MDTVNIYNDLVKRVNSTAINAAGQAGVLSGTDPTEVNPSNVSDSVLHAAINSDILTPAHHPLLYSTLHHHLLHARSRLAVQMDPAASSHR